MAFEGEAWQLHCPHAASWRPTPDTRHLHAEQQGGGLPQLSPAAPLYAFHGTCCIIQNHNEGAPLRVPCEGLWRLTNLMRLSFVFPLPPFPASSDIS